MHKCRNWMNLPLASSLIVLWVSPSVRLWTSARWLKDASTFSSSSWTVISFIFMIFLTTYTAYLKFRLSSVSLILSFFSEAIENSTVASVLIFLLFGVVGVEIYCGPRKISKTWSFSIASETHLDSLGSSKFLSCWDYAVSSRDLKFFRFWLEKTSAVTGSPALC